MSISRRMRRSVLTIIRWLCSRVLFRFNEPSEKTSQTPSYSVSLSAFLALRISFAIADPSCLTSRLRTIIDYDKVLVLDAGNVAEYDSPRNLLLREGSSFRKMCEQAADWEELKVLAGL